MFFFRQRRERAEKRAAAERALEMPDAVNGVGPLAEALWLGDSKLQARTAMALIRLLPRLKAEDAYLLNAKRRACLYRALNDINAPLTIAVLKALEQIGDESSLSAVIRLTEKGLASAEDRRIRQAAMECLPVVMERVQYTSLSKTLLHPSAEPLHSEQLLQASQSPGVPSSALRQSEGSADE